MLKTGVPRILLDNFTTYDIREAVDARERTRRDRNLRRRHARTHSRARHDRRAVRVDRRADAFGACRGSELRARAGVMMPGELAAALAALVERRPDARSTCAGTRRCRRRWMSASTLARDGARAWRRGRGRRADGGPRPARPHVGIAARRGTLFLVHRAASRVPDMRCRCSRSPPVSPCATASSAATGLARRSEVAERRDRRHAASWPASSPKASRSARPIRP